MIFWKQWDSFAFLREEGAKLGIFVHQGGAKWGIFQHLGGVGGAFWALGAPFGSHATVYAI